MSLRNVYPRRFLNRLLDQEKGKCCSIVERKKFEVRILCPMNVVPPSIEGVNCTCRDYMLCKLVMLIAISSNHFL